MSRAKKSGPHPRWRRRFLIAALALLLAAAVLAAAVYVPWTHWFGALMSRLRHLGQWGPVLFGLGYVAAEMLLLPATPLTILGAIAYGFWAFPLVFSAAMLAATLSFLASRYLFRDRVKRWLSTRKELPALDQALREGGWKSVFLVTLSPLIPFSIQNYLMGTTRVSLRSYLAGTAVGILPSTALCVYIGAAGKHLHQGSGTLHWTLLGAGLLATVALSVWMARKAKRQLGRAEKAAA